MEEAFRYGAIFKAPMVQGPQIEVDHGDLKVMNIVGPENFAVQVQCSRTQVLGRGGPLLTGGEINLPHGERFLAIIAEQAERKAEGPDIQRNLESRIDCAITALSVFYQPQIFFEQVYRGPILNGKKFILHTAVRPAELCPILKDELAIYLTSVEKSLSADDDVRERYAVMSRFYSRSLSFDPSEEKFLLLWTALEVYPMKGTANIRPVNELIAKILSSDVSQVKQALQFGRMHGIRSKLAHDGFLEIGTEASVDVFRKLELVVHEVLRSMLGLPYSGSLDRYFARS